MEISDIIKKLEEHRDRIGKERDGLRNIIDEYEALAENCDSAIEDIRHAVDTLSEHA